VLQALLAQGLTTVHCRVPVHSGGVIELFGFAEQFYDPTQERCEGTKSHRRQFNGFMALGGQSQTCFFSSFFAALPRKKKKKGYFWGMQSPKPPRCKAASR
jgi:hypothetical protein